MIKINDNNTAVRALTQKNLLENRLVAAIDAGRIREANFIAGELELLGLSLSDAVLRIVRGLVQKQEEIEARRQSRRRNRRYNNAA